MKHQRATGEIRERAALYALGLLEPALAHRFEKHVADECEVCRAELTAFRDTLGALPFSLPLAQPPASLRDRLMARIKPGPQVWKEWQPASMGSGTHLVPAGPAGWQPVGLPGVSAKQLYSDPELDQVTMLIRMEPGSTYPGHRHGGPEQCFVIEGDLWTGDSVLRAGDYQCLAKDSVHPPHRTEQGCLLLIVSSRHDELLA